MNELLTQILLMDPKDFETTLSGYVERYKPTAYIVLKELLKIYKDFVNETEYVSLAAKQQKKKYDAYMEVGFTPEQAMLLIINDNVALTEAVKQFRVTTNSDK